MGGILEASLHIGLAVTDHCLRSDEFFRHILPKHRLEAPPWMPVITTTVFLENSMHNNY